MTIDELLLFIEVQLTNNSLTTKEKRAVAKLIEHAVKFVESQPVDYETELSQPYQDMRGAVVDLRTLIEGD